MSMPGLISSFRRLQYSPARDVEDNDVNVIDKTDRTVGATTQPAGDLDRFRLRRFLEDLVAAGEVERRDSPVDLAGIAEILDGNPRAVHFRAVGPEHQELVGNVVSS